jgi:hypothetical protein
VASSSAVSSSAESAQQRRARERHAARREVDRQRLEAQPIAHLGEVEPDRLRSSARGPLLFVVHRSILEGQPVPWPPDPGQPASRAQHGARLDRKNATPHARGAGTPGESDAELPSAARRVSDPAARSRRGRARGRARTPTRRRPRGPGARPPPSRHDQRGTSTRTPLTQRRICLVVKFVKRPATSSVTDCVEPPASSTA